MDVQLYVYDISKGLARQWSAALLGTQIDAVYHTSIVLEGTEYFFGAGVQTSFAGATHHGQPIEVILLGQTQLPHEVILEYLDSLRQVYTMESYDLFLHNCNNFTNDFATFLVGKGIPQHITSLPQTVLDTPFGQMLKPQLDQSMRGITQAPVPAPNVPSSQYPQSRMADVHAPSGIEAKSSTNAPGNVYKPTTMRQLDDLLARAKDRCAIVFFTSATCPPCKLVYPAYDELAAAAGSQAVFIKVELSAAYEIGARYQVRVTPTFWTFLRGEKENEWKGANESQLRGNVNLLLQMAHPAHRHSLRRMPTLQKPHKQPVIYTKVPPLDKITAKLGSSGSDPAVTALRGFILARHKAGAIEAPLPQMPTINVFVLKSLPQLPVETLFPLVDLLRLSLVDPRVSGYYATDADETLRAVLERTVNLDTKCPYQLRIVTLHMACNFFSSKLLQSKVTSDPKYSSLLVQLVTSSLLDTSHQPIRVAAASLAFNIAASNHLRRIDDQEDSLPESDQVGLTASLLEAIGKERESLEGLRGMLLAVGLLKYRCPEDGELEQLCEAVNAKDIVKEATDAFSELRELAIEVEQVM